MCVLVGWSRALVSCEGVRVARGACARYLCVLTSPYCPLLRSRGVTASTLLCYREYDTPDGTSARFLPLIAAATDHPSSQQREMLPAGAATGRSCALPSTSSAFVARAQRVAHEQLPLSDHRGQSSGHCSNEQSHRCCSSCKSWPSLRLRFCSHRFVVVLRNSSLFRRMQTRRVCRYSFCGQLQ